MLNIVDIAEIKEPEKFNTIDALMDPVQAQEHLKLLYAVLLSLLCSSN